MSIFGKGQTGTTFEKTGDLVYLLFKNKIKMNSTLNVGERQVAYVMVNDRITDEFLPGSYNLTVATLPIATRALKLQKKMNNAKSIIKSITADLYIVNKEQVIFDQLNSFKFVIKDKEFGRIETNANFSCELKVSNSIDFLESLRKFVAVVGKGVSVKLLKELAEDAISTIMQKNNIQIRNFMTKKEETEEIIFEKFVEKMQKIGIEVISFSMNRLNLKKSIAQIFENVVDYTTFEKQSIVEDKNNQNGAIIFERVGMQGEGDRKVEATVINNNKAEQTSEFLNIDNFADMDVKPKREFRINLDGNNVLTSSGIENRNEQNMMQNIDNSRDNIFERRREEGNIFSSDNNASLNEKDSTDQIPNVFGARGFQERRNVFERRSDASNIQNQETRTCKNCGKVLELDAEFCSKCGTKVEK